MAQRQTLLQQCYLVAIDSPDVSRLQFQYTPPTISYDRTANIANVAIVGRNDDLHHFVGGSTSISFDMDFYSTEANRLDVKNKIKWLESMTYSDGDRPPSRIKIIFGELFKDEIWILTGVSTQYSIFDLSQGALPLYATASLSFVRDTSIDLTARQVRNSTF